MEICGRPRVSLGDDDFGASLSMTRYGRASETLEGKKPNESSIPFVSENSWLRSENDAALVSDGFVNQSETKISGKLLHSDIEKADMNLNSATDKESLELVPCPNVVENEIPEQLMLTADQLPLQSLATDEDDSNMFICMCSCSELE